MITYPNVKVNLGLSVLRKRPDGYHDLETLFVPCFDIHDTLEIISGGATTSLPRIWEGNMPPRINMLRVGEGIILARDLEIFYNCPQPELMKDNFRLKAEVIEVKDKPSHPVGEIAVDAFGHKPTYVDRGIRKRALLGIGKVDYADFGEIFPLEVHIQFVFKRSGNSVFAARLLEQSLIV